MDKYSRVCHLALCARVRGPRQPRDVWATCALPHRHQESATPKGARQPCTVHAPPVTQPSRLRGPADPEEGTREMAQLQQITLARTESPTYTRIGIIKRGSVDLKVQCHPHQALDGGSFALQKPFYEVNYINYQRLKTSNI